MALESRQIGVDGSLDWVAHCDLHSFPSRQTYSLALELSEGT